MGNGGGYPPLNTDDFRDSGFWTLPYPEGHKRRSQLEVGTQRACRRLVFNNYFWDAEMHRRWRVVASSSGANFLPRNFDEIFEPLSFAIPKSPTTTQARPSSGQGWSNYFYGTYFTFWKEAKRSKSRKICVSCQSVKTARSELRLTRGVSGAN